MSKIILAVVAMFFSGQRCSRRGCGLWVGAIHAFFLVSISAMSLSGCAGMIYGGNSAFRATSSPEYINVDKIQLDFSTGNGLLTTLNALTPIGFIAPVFGVPRKTYMGALNLTVTPQDAMNGIDRNALTFVVPQDQSVTVTLDFNAKLREQLTQSGQGTKYFPGKLIITIVCKHAICRASADPDIISPSGAITLQSKHLVYEKRMREIAVEEQIKLKEAAKQLRIRNEQVASKLRSRDVDAGDDPTQDATCRDLLAQNPEGSNCSALLRVAAYGGIPGQNRSWKQHRCDAWLKCKREAEAHPATAASGTMSADEAQQKSAQIVLSAGDDCLDSESILHNPGNAASFGMYNPQGVARAAEMKCAAFKAIHKAYVDRYGQDGQTFLGQFCSEQYHGKCSSALQWLENHR